jgi:REP element-mobilizing transposase RayT
MKYDPAIHHRRSIRLPGYDYSQPGAYFVTIVTHHREHLFGEITNGEMRLNKIGRIVQFAWNDLPKWHRHVRLGAFCIMPNHVHAVIILVDTTLPKRHALPEIVRGLKSRSAQRINRQRKMPGIPVWHRNYYEHIMRDEREHERIDLYIESNPANWMEDAENIGNAGEG